MDLTPREPVAPLSSMFTRQQNWQPITTAPHGADLELAVINRDGIHALVFPCRRMSEGWVRANTCDKIEVSPTHWRDWNGADT